MGSNIPEFQTQQLAQQAVGTPGAALGPSRALFNVAGQFRFLSRSLAIQENRAQLEAQRLEKELRKQFVESEVQRMILDQEPVFTEQFEGVKQDIENPLDVPRRFGEERQKFSDQITQGIKDPDIKAAFSKKFLARGIERQGSLTRAAITETVQVIKQNAEHELDTFATQAGNVVDEREFEDILSKIVAKDENGDSVFGATIGANADSKVAAAAEQAIENRTSNLLVSGEYEGALAFMDKYKSFIDGDKRLAMTQRARNLQNSQKDLDLSTVLAEVKQQVNDKGITPQEGDAVLDELNPETAAGVRSVQATRDRFKRENTKQEKDAAAFKAFKETEQEKFSGRVRTTKARLAQKTPISQSDRNAGLPALLSKISPIFTAKRGGRPREVLALQKQRIDVEEDQPDPDRQFRRLTDSLLIIDEAIADGSVTAAKVAPIRSIITKEVNKRIEDSAADSIAAPLKDRESRNWVAMRLVNQTRDEKIARLAGLQQYLNTLPETGEFGKAATAERFREEYTAEFFRLADDNPARGDINEQTKHMQDLDNRALETSLAKMAIFIETVQARNRIRREKEKRGQ